MHADPNALAALTRQLTKRGSQPLVKGDQSMTTNSVKPNPTGAMGVVVLQLCE
jgi:hypothetical protein